MGESIEKWIGGVCVMIDETSITIGQSRSFEKGSVVSNGLGRVRTADLDTQICGKAGAARLIKRD